MIRLQPGLTRPATLLPYTTILRSRRNENRVATAKAPNARARAAPSIAPLQTEPKRGALTSAGSSRSLPAYSFVNWAKAVVTGCSLLACQGSLVISASKERTGRMASNKRSRTTEARLGGLQIGRAHV